MKQKPFDAFSPFYSVLPRKPVGSGGHSVTNRSAELDDILEEDKEGDGDDEHDGSPSPPAFSNSITCSPQESFRFVPLESLLLQGVHFIV